MSETPDLSQYKSFEPIDTPDGEQVKAVDPETGKQNLFTHDEVLRNYGHDPNERQIPVEAIHHGQKDDIPVRVVGSFGKGTDGREYLKVEGSNTGIPRDEIEFTQPQPPETDETAENLKTPLENEDTGTPEEENKHEEVRQAEKAMHKSLIEARHADLEGRHGDYVKHLSDLVYNISEIARERGLSKDEHLKFAERILSELETRDKREETSLMSMYDMNHIVDLRNEYRRVLDAEKARRDKLQDTEPVDEYARSLKKRLIDKYVQTGGKERPMTEAARRRISELMEMPDEQFGREISKEEKRQVPKSKESAVMEKWPEFSLKEGDTIQLERADGSGEKEGWVFKGIYAKKGELFANLERTVPVLDRLTQETKAETETKAVLLRNVVQPQKAGEAGTAGQGETETLEEAAKPKEKDFKELGTTARIKRLMAAYMKELTVGTFYYPTEWYKKMKKQGGKGKERLDGFLLRKYEQLNLTDEEKKIIRRMKIGRIAGSAAVVGSGLGFGLGFGL